MTDKPLIDKPLIDYEAALAALQEVVTGNEDYVYVGFNNSCDYVDREGCSSCGVGKVFIDQLDVPVDFFSGARNTSIVDTVVNVPEFPLQLTDKAKDLLSVFQGLQDEDMPWGDALERAIDYVYNVRYDQHENYRTY
jgi:hypothetical protein